MPTSGFSIKPLEVKLLAGEQKATEVALRRLSVGSTFGWTPGCLNPSQVGLPRRQRRALHG